jgi:regulatory protein
MQKRLTKAEAKSRILRYCVYQERCHQEVKEKLFSFGLSRTDTDDLMTDLITDGFLNEERFAKAFAGGKFRMRQWGRLKIIRELKSRGLTANCIKSGLKEIDDGDYRKSLTLLLEKKSSAVSGENSFVIKDKLSRFAIQKGYEPELVWIVLKDLFLKG